MTAQILFVICLAIAIFIFTRNVRKIIRNIHLGRDEKITGDTSRRWRTLLRVALGQSKIMSKPLAGIFHVIIYAGFIIINTEVLEIMIDGIFGTHRIFAAVLPGGLYGFIIAVYEWLAVLTILAAVVFLCRRYIIRLSRFTAPDLDGWPRRDAAIILLFELVLMFLFLSMNAADHLLQQSSVEHYIHAGWFPVSALFFEPLYRSLPVDALIMVERAAWWMHITGILVFLNYLVISKHFHIIISFPNVFFSNLFPQGRIKNSAAVTREVKLMLDPAAVPDAGEQTAARFGAKDINDLSWKQLMDAYSCTECGRCTAACPANITGKKLSPRLIMMKTRDRIEEVGKQIDQHGAGFSDQQSLLGDYITEEELWACTTCNACVEACPVNISPMGIIMDLRQSLVMEESKMPNELAMMNTNIENNGAPWQFSPGDRFNWADGLDIPLMADVAARGETADVLFWVGCAGSFDDRYKNVTRSFARILTAAGIRFAVMGTEETCTGDPAKRAGNEFLFQMQAFNNITNLNNYGVKKIVTACPHCFNTLKNEYPELGGNYEVMHHTAFLQQLLLDGKIKIREDSDLRNRSITYHDSCYIGRGNGIYEAPRSVLENFKSDLKEMKRCRTNGLCCGAGGAQVFKEEEPGKKRVNTERAEDVLATGAGIVAVACPFCMTMLDDGLKNKAGDDAPKIKDIAELVAQNL
ncbi:MAG: 4Fe-4S dicluster domain-containing protein [Chitinophagales bacterium]|nr:4Fe-4S dicluster domain-containing protein [Chitinophagales bacterium]